MASLAPIRAEDITATYHGLSHTLELQAKGEIVKYYHEPFFVYDELWVGGLRFSLQAFRDPVGQTVQVPYEAERYYLEFSLPQSHFNSKSVLVETLLGTFEIEITYIGIPGPGDEPQPPHPEKVPNKDVLPPINKALGPGRQLIITAKVPQQEIGFPKSWIRPSFNKKYFQLVNAQYIAGNIVWSFKWTEQASDKTSPQLINVITETWNGILGAGSTWSILSQGYIVHYIDIIQ